MDDFNNFFDDQRDEQPMHTPVYHTPEPRNRNKLNAATIICIVVAAVMCVVVLVNVIVLASLKQSIAEEYAASISASMREQYKNAIDESLSDTNVVDEVTKAATEQALQRLRYAVGKVADEECSPSVARLYMYTESSNEYGVASGFLITNTDESGTTQRYLLTNAHCVRYAHETKTGYGFNQRIYYSWASYKRIVAIFDGEDKEYELEIVAYGAYDDQNLSAENSQPDIAVLRIKGEQPDNQNKPALKLITNDNYVGRGDPVALIGNPEEIGNKNTITSGSVSQVGLTLSDWGAGAFIMTDAAVNSGNSGGPMVNILGDVVGIVESKLADGSIDNMGFALSADTIRSFLTWASTNNTLNTDLSSVFQNL